MTPTDVANIALLEIGNRVRINSFSDGSPAANAVATLYTPKVQALMRAAHWDFARAQTAFTQWKAVVINGALSNSPPPQPWQFSYLYPSDCLKVRFLRPTTNTSTSGQVVSTGPSPYWPYPSVSNAGWFTPGTDFDANGNPIRVVLTNIYQAQGIYTRDLTQTPDAWDPLFLSAATAFLASFLVPALGLDKQLMQLQTALAKSMIDQARSMNGNESMGSVDHTPDWISARQTTGIPWLSGQTGYGTGWYSAGWDAVGCADGTSY